MRIIDPKTNQPFAEAYAGGGFGFSMPAQNKPIDAFIQQRKIQTDIASIEASLDHGFAQAGVQLHIDQMVGSLFKLKYLPMASRLGLSREEVKPFVTDVKDWWSEVSEDPRCFIDAEEKRTFTMMIREVAGTHTRQGEWMAQPLWRSRAGTSLRTCIKVVNPNRVSNPNGAMNSANLRGGVRLNKHGAPRRYCVQQPNHNGFGQNQWIEIPAYTQFGRRSFLHIFEPIGDGQTRAPAQFVSIIKRLGKLDRFQDAVLENAIVNAMMAVTIQSELGADAAFDLISSGDVGENKLLQYADTLAQYYSKHKGVIMGKGTRASHLLPGEELHIHRAGVDGSGISDYERSLLRYIAAGLNVSYEQLAKDYSQVSYSSARAALNETFRYMMGRRKVICARAASEIFMLCFEDALDSGELVLPSKARRSFYEARHAWTNAEWIGSGRLAIDELKEAKAASERLANGTSTIEDELAVQGKDYDTWLDQRQREIEETKGLCVAPYSPKYVAPVLDEEDEAPVKGKTSDATTH
ncbi:phage portal protein [Vibrio cholerae]|nr:phage portal protein [Vibrio cholerae]